MMKTLRVTVQLFLLFLLLVVPGVASASDLTLSGLLHFPSLDGSAQDADGLADGTFTVDGDLVIEGTIHCNDAPPLPQSAGACPIRISVAGDLTLEPGSGIMAENRRGNGSGGDIELEVGGDLTVRGPEGSLPGAVLSTSQVIGTGGTAGDLTSVVTGAVDLQAGSVLAVNSKSGSAGAIAVTGESVLAAGLVAAGPSRTLLSTPLTGEVLGDGSVGQAGGTIHLRALGSEEPGLRIDSTGIVVSQGEGNGGRLILLEACGIEVRGLVASLSRNNGPSQVVLRSGKGILVDGRDLGTPLPAEGRFGRIRADGTQQGAAGYLVDLFAESDIQVLGPEPSSAQGLFAVTSRPGEQPLRNAGGTITAISLSGSLTAAGNAFETGRDVQGDKGGAVDLQARGDVTLDGATIWAVGGFTSTLSPNARAGGHIDIRSFQGAVSWTFGVGDVRPTGTGVAAARRGTIEITACTTVDTTGSQFPVNGSPVAPFPVETEGVCSPTAPSLPEGEPPLPTCAPANQPPAPSGGPFSLEENSAFGTVVGTVSANDPDPGQTHTFSIFAGNTGNAFAIDPSTGEITVNDSDALDFETTPSFSLVIRATDSGVPALSGDGTVIVTLTNRNEAPMDLALDGPLTVNENAPAGTLVGNLSTVDPDSPDSHTYLLVPGEGSANNGSFQISGNQLQVLLPPNYEALQALSVRVRTTDAGGLSYEEAFTLTVIDLNEPPTPVLDAYTAFGNTQLVAGGLAGTHRAFSTDPDQVDTNDIDPDTNPAFRNLSVVAASGTTSKGGSYSVDAEGRFTYQPPVGFVTTTANPADPTGPDTFTYSLTDGTNTTPGGEVRITVNHRIWYVHNDPGTAGDAGDSADPVDTLAEAETKSAAGDHIYVFEGDGSDTGMDAGITLKDGQKLIGERFDLVVAGTTLVDADGTRRPEISDSNDTVSALANTANGHRTGIEIRGLQLSSTGGNAIDLTSADAANLEATIHDVAITGTGALQEGIDVNAGSTGAATVSVTNTSLTTAGNSFDARTSAAGSLWIDFSNNTDILSNASGVVIDGSGGGPITITGFAGNSVHPNTLATGISVANATFDAVPGGAVQQVDGDSLWIGIDGDGVSGAGMQLVAVQGNLFFDDLRVYGGTTGLQVSGTGSGMVLAVAPAIPDGSGTSEIKANAGAAVDVTSVSLDLRLNELVSVTSGSGVSLAGLGPNSRFSAPSGSSITKASGSGAAFSVTGSGSGTAVSYAGTLNVTAGSGVSLNSNAGATIGFSGGMALSTGANTAFSATGGGTITVADPPGLANNTVATTTGTAVNITGTAIGSNGVTFESISSTAAGTNTAIILDNTGTGPFMITGTGASGTGGTISNKTVDAMTMNNTDGPVTLKNMIIQDIGDVGGGVNSISGDDAIHGQQVDGGLALENMIIRRVSDQAIHGALFAGGATLWNGLTITNSTIEDTNRFSVANVGDANNEGMIRITGIRGVVSITGSTLQRGGELVDFFVTDGTLNMTATTNNFSFAYKEFTSGTTASVGGHCIDVTVQGTANADITIGDRNNDALDNNFLNCRLGSVRVANEPGATGNIDVVIGRNDFSVNDHSSGIGGDFDFPQGGVLIMSRGTDTATFDVVIDGNYFDEISNASGGVGQVSYDMQNGIWQVLMEENTFDSPGNASWFLRADSTASAKVLFQNNLGIKGFFNCPDPSCAGGYDGPGLRALADVQNGGILDLTIIGDQFAEHDAGFDPGQTFEARVLNTGGGGTLCLDLQNNQAPDGYSLEEFAGDFNLIGSGSCPAGSPSASCQTLLGSRGNRGGSNIATTNPPFVNVEAGSSIDVVPGACQQPSGIF